MEIVNIYTKLLHILLILLLSPFLFGIINRTKAFFAGRKGAPLLQLYYDIFKLLRKGAVYSTSTTWIFVSGPVVGLSAVIIASMMLPFAGSDPLISFEGDLVLFIYLLGLARFFTVVAALDTGSSFEGMGSSREVQFAVFAEPALFLSLAALARQSGQISLKGIFASPVIITWASYGPMIFIIVVALFFIFLAENCRIPVDDPNTHLELTMIHEVMVLDHGGVDFAFILYGAALKFWILGALLVGIFLGPYSLSHAVNSLIFIIGMILLAIIVGITESILARLRLLKIPQFLIVSLVLSVVALILTMRS